MTSFCDFLFELTPDKMSILEDFPRIPKLLWDIYVLNQSMWIKRAVSIYLYALFIDFYLRALVVKV